MRVLIDTNILVDAASFRIPFYKSAQDIIRFCGEGKIEGFISSHSLSNIFYILRKEYDYDERKKIITLLRKSMKTVVISNDMIDAALANDKITDFEDALQYECAEEMNAEYIVSRDKNGYSKMPIKTVTAEELVNLLS